MKYIKRIVFLIQILLGVLGGNIFAQNTAIDSLLSILNEKKEDSSKVNLLNNLSSKLLSISDYGKALNYAEQSKKLADKINYHKGKYVATNTAGVIHGRMGNYPEAIKNYMQNLKYAQQENNNIYLSHCYINIGNVYSDINKYDEALKYYKLALNVDDKTDTEVFVTKLMNIANVYRYKGNINEAIRIYIDALSRLKNKGLLNLEGLVCLNIGGALGINKEYENSLAYTVKAEKLFLHVGNKYALALALSNSADIYISQGKNNEARLSLTKALALAHEVNSYVALEYCYENIARLDSITGNYKNAIANYRLYYAYKDSVKNSDKKKEVEKIHMRYEFEKQQETDSLRATTYKIKTEAKLKQNQTYIWGLSLMLLLLGVVGTLIYRQYKLTQRQHSIIEEQKKKEILQLEQKLLRSQMNPHFIFNAVSVINSLIIDQKNQIAVQYLHRFASLTRQVLEYSEQEYISLADEIELLENYIELQKIIANNRFSYKIEVSHTIDTTNVFVPPMLAQPFIENAIKYGITGSAGYIEIFFTKDDDNLILTVEDNGPGINAENSNTHQSMATNIVKRRINLYSTKKEFSIQLKNKIDALGKTVGTKVSLEIPHLID